MECHARWLTLLGCLAAQGCGEPLVERLTEVEQCPAVRLQGRLELTSVASDVAGITLRGSDAALANSDVTLSREGASISSPQHQLQVRLHCAGLNSLELIGEVDGELSEAVGGLHTIGVYGVSRLHLQGAAAEVMTVRVAGQGQLMLTDVIADQVDLQAAGDSRVVLSGESDSAVFNVSGQSEIDASAFSAQQVYVALDGRSRTVLHVGAHLRGSVAPSAQLSYSGTPDVALDPGQGASSATAREAKAGVRGQ